MRQRNCFYQHFSLTLDAQNLHFEKNNNVDQFVTISVDSLMLSLVPSKGNKCFQKKSEVSP